LRYAIPVTFGAVGLTLLFAISSIYIERFYDTEQVGYFSVGLTLMQFFSFLPDAIITLLLPKAAGLDDKRKIIRPLRLAVFACAATSILLFIPVYIFRDFVISLLFSSKYLAAAVTLLPLIFSHIFLAMHQTYGSAFQGLGRPGAPSLIIAIAAGINLIAGFFLTKSHGILGASVALAFSAFVAWIITVIVWERWIKKGGLKIAEPPETPA
jgi:O-antigen/teichoic acid export membrane protein